MLCCNKFYVYENEIGLISNVTLSTTPRHHKWRRLVSKTIVSQAPTTRSTPTPTHD
jgi:hypothetical protein